MRRFSGKIAGHRSGLSLLEVILSTAIFLGALTAIMSVLQVGHRSRIEAVLTADGVLRCETIMSELIAGVRPLASSGSETFEDDPKWFWTATVSDQGSTSLMKVDVTVEHKVNGTRTNAVWSLTRYIRDPVLFAEQAGGTQ